jgi:hypothetical protein
MGGPLHKHIADELPRKIDPGDVAPGSQLPTGVELMDQYHAARNTVSLRTLRYRPPARCAPPRRCRQASPPPLPVSGSVVRVMMMGFTCSATKDPLLCRVFTSPRITIWLTAPRTKGPDGQSPRH